MKSDATLGKPPRLLRVAFCIDSFDVGGTELNAVRTAERFDRTRVHIEFFCLSARGPLLERVQRDGFRVHTVTVKGFMSLATVRAGWRFARQLRRERFDIVHSHDIYTNIALVPWARMAGVPLVLASRRWWTETNRLAHRSLNRWSYRLAHRVLANSESVGQLVVSEGVPIGKVCVVPNFVDESAFLPPPDSFVDDVRAELGLTVHHIVIGIVANLHAIKDHSTLLRASALLVSEFPNLRIVFVGDGVERERLLHLSESLGLGSHVIFAGRRPHQPSMHWLFDVAVLCSRGEGFPNSIVEGMAAGRPLVATAVGGVHDVIVDGETGLLVRPGDPEAIASAIRYVLSDRARAIAMGRAGSRRARALFYSDRVIALLDQSYRDALEAITQDRHIGQ